MGKERRPMGKAGGLLLGGVAISPVVFLAVTIFFPVQFVRAAGCSGKIEGAWLDAASERVVVAQHLWASADEGADLYSLPGCDRSR